MIFPMELIPYVDYIVLGLVILFVIIGLYKGFLLMVVELASLLVTLFVSYIISPVLAAQYNLSQYLEIDVGLPALSELINGRVNDLLWFLIVFAILSLIFLILRPLCKALGEIPIIKQVNALLGALFGFVKAYILVLLFIFVLLTPFVKNGNIVLQETALGNIYKATAMTVDAFKQPAEFNEMLSRIITDQEIRKEDYAEFVSWLQEYIADQQLIDEILKQIHLIE